MTRQGRRAHGWFMAVLAGVAACDAEDEVDPRVCEQAQAALDACAGPDGAEPAFPSCDATAQDEARELIDALDTRGCPSADGKNDVASLCDLLGFSIPGLCSDDVPVLLADPTGSPTRFPIILAHGFNTSTTNFWRFNDVDVELAKDGHRVFLGSVPPFDTPLQRARHLADDIDAALAQTGAAKVNLICFSMGGLDCRALASPGGLDYGDRIASITTISSPHGGTFVGDVAAGLLPGSNTRRGEALAELVKLYGATFSDVPGEGHVAEALADMSEARAQAFADAFPDHPAVTIRQAWAGWSNVLGLANPDRDAERLACTDAEGVDRRIWNGELDSMSKLLVGSAAFVGHFGEAVPNDGVSTIRSSRAWGEFQGCIPADHLDQVGQIDDVRPDPDTGFDYIEFYRHIAFDLARQGV